MRAFCRLCVEGNARFLHHSIRINPDGTITARKILGSSQKLEQTLCKRLDADRLVCSPRLNHLQMNALQSAKNSDAFRLKNFIGEFTMW